MKKLITAFLFLVLSVPSCFATSITFQQGVSPTAGYTGSKDAYILPGATNQHSRSSSNTLIRSSGGTYQNIGYFDVSDIPTTATVNSATMTIYLQSFNCTTETIGIRVIENPDSSGSPSFNTSAGDAFNNYATWAYKNHTTTTDWDSVNSNNFSDVDDNAEEDTAAISACPGSWESRTFTVTSMVTAWVADPNDNGGYALTCADSCSAGSYPVLGGTSGQRPSLTVDYTAAGGGGGGSGTSQVIIIQ